MMRRFLVLLIALAAGLPLLVGPRPAAPAEVSKPATGMVTLARGDTYAIKGATLIDMTGRPPLKNAVVVVDQGYIAAAGPLGKVPIPKGAQTLDAKGLTLLPGFIDMHVHSTVQGGMMPYFLANGITSVRDLGCAEKMMPDLLRYRRQVDKREVVGPRLFLSGPPIDGKPRAANWFPGPTVVGAEQARAAVNSLADQGVDLIKLYRRLSIEDGKAAVEAAHARDLPVTWDYRWNMRYLQRALHTGVDSIEHVFFSETSSAAERELLADFIGKSKTWFDPTLVAFRAHNDQVTDDPVFKQLPPGIPSFWRSLFWPMETPQEFASMKSFVRRVQRHGGRFLVGTDTPVKYVAPGFAFHEELYLLTQCRLSNMDVLRAATVNAARALRRENELGTIQPGRKADMVLIQGDPLQDIKVTRNIRWVIRAGEIFDPKPLLTAARTQGPQKAVRLPAPVSRH